MKEKEAKIIGIGVGKHTHTLVMMNGEEAEEQYIPNDHTGLAAIVDLLNNGKKGYKVVFIGNRRWVVPLASGLARQGITPYYHAIKTKRGKRGKAGKVSETIAKLIKFGINLRLFFQEKKKKVARKEELSKTYQIAAEYLKAANEVREAKHNMLNCLSVIFPEAVKAGTTEKRLSTGEKINLPIPLQPPEFFTKKMALARNNPDPFYLENTENEIPQVVKELAKSSLGKFVEKEEREKNMRDYQNYLHEYNTQSALKEEKMMAIRKAVANHPLIKSLGNKDTICLLAAMLGWREWPRWRELRHFCGLDVTRQDDKGNIHISRVRPEIRQYLFIFLKTSEGKAIAEEVKQRVSALKKERIEKAAIEYVKKNFPGLEGEAKKTAIKKAKKTVKVKRSFTLIKQIEKALKFLRHTGLKPLKPQAES